MFNEFEPQKGSLLLSEPFMLDQNFERSVILICEHNMNDGTVGMILNHRSVMVLADIMEGIEDVNVPLYLGGPVHQNTLFFIHRAYDRLYSGSLISDDMYWGGNFELLKELINNKEIAADEFKLFLGYSGWSPKQLEQEINQNSWAVHNSFAMDLAFIADGEDLWKNALISLGPKYAHVANFPKNPNYN